MARPYKHVHAIDGSNNTLIHVNDKENKSRRITGLSYHPKTRRYYSIDTETGKRTYLGTDVTGAVRAYWRNQLKEQRIRGNLGDVRRRSTAS